MIYYSTRTFDLSYVARAFTGALSNGNYWFKSFMLAVVIDLGFVDVNSSYLVATFSSPSSFETSIALFYLGDSFN